MLRPRVPTPARPAAAAQGIHALAVDSRAISTSAAPFRPSATSAPTALARWDGSAWHVLGGDSSDKGNGVDGVGYALAVDSSDNLYVGGDFQNAFATRRR